MTEDRPPTLSVITPVLNGERFVSGCLENVLGQGSGDVEHLIVDGGSTDRTEAIVLERAAEHASIRWIQEKGANQSRALNLGVSQSKGLVLGVLNVDDYYAPGALPRVLEHFAGLPSPMLLVGNCNVWEGDSLSYVNRPAELRFEKLLLGPEFYPFPFNPASYFYDKSLHERIGLYDISDEYSMDLDFLLRAVRCAHVVYVDEIWGNFRVHAEAKTTQDRRRGSQDRRRNSLLRRYRQMLGPRERAALQVELAFRRSHLAMKRIRWRVGATVGRFR